MQNVTVTDLIVFQKAVVVLFGLVLASVALFAFNVDQELLQVVHVHLLLLQFFSEDEYLGLVTLEVASDVFLPCCRELTVREPLDPGLTKVREDTVVVPTHLDNDVELAGCQLVVHDNDVTSSMPL
jgi:hypothetical protein